jgi:hypothetical protein
MSIAMLDSGLAWLLTREYKPGGLGLREFLDDLALTKIMVQDERQ